MQTVIEKRFTDSKPNVVYLSSAGTLGKYPLSHRYFRKATISLLKYMQQFCETYYVRGIENHLGNGVFTNGYQLINGTFKKYPDRIHARVVYNKAPLHSNGGRSWTVVNKWDLMKQMQDKFMTYRLFHAYMKPTYRVKNKAQFHRTLPRIRTNLAVFKPVSGNSGKGITIDTHAGLRKRVRQYDGLLQEFIDTSHGLPGISTSYHDVRLVLMNGSVVQTYARTPKAGSYLANAAQGGKMFEVSAADIPQRAFHIAKKIDHYFSRYEDRIYTVDFGFEYGQPFLIELNPQPGLPYTHWPSLHQKFRQGLVDTFLAAAQH